MSKLAQAVMLLTCIWEMLYSNIGCNANYSEGFLLHNFQFIIDINE